ncbi:hemicentin-1 [Dermacentor silvarum]|uniref:hemicentin-1 n=1 Tax=Dermacentor silvarum TaxID=543639 RepID=UPI00210165B6|nr:hemicentin-1 [Dermacentor silvarum]
MSYCRGTRSVSSPPQQRHSQRPFEKRRLELTCGFVRIVVLSVMSIAPRPGYCFGDDHFGRGVDPRGTTVLATDGGRAVIPCLAKLRVESRNDSAVLVRWFRGGDNSTEPFYSLDARSRRGGLSKGHHTRGEAWKGRSFFSVLQEPPSLKVNRVDYADRGTYVCDLLYASGRRYSATVALAVFVPPTEFVIKDVNGNVVRDSVGPYTEGDNLFLVCEIIGGKPRFLTTWQNNLGAAANVSSVVEEDDVHRTFLRIEPLRRHHWGLNATCTASILDGLFSKSLSIHVLIHLPPASTVITASHTELYFEEPAEFVCTSRGSRPAAEIRWFLGSSPVESLLYRTTTDGNVTTSFVLVTPTKERNGERLKCVAFNKSLRGSELSSETLLEIKYKPQVTLEFGAGLKESMIYEGHDIFFVCNASAYPSITDVVWKLNGVPLEQPHEQHRVQLQQSANASSSPSMVRGPLIVNQRYLVLRNVQSSDSGNYSCTVTNPEGVTTSKTLQIRIQHSPRCQNPQQQHHAKVVYTAPFEEVSLSCDVEADPSTNLTFRWSMKESHRASIATASVAPGDAVQREAAFARDFDGMARAFASRSVLTFVPLPEELHSTFQCWAKNPVGIQKKPCLFRLVPKEVPSHVRECQLLNKTLTSLLIECQRRSDDHHTFVMELHDASSNLLVRRVTSATPRFQLSELRPTTYYTILVYTTNGVESSRTLNISISSTEAAMAKTYEKDGGLSKLNLGAIVGPVAGTIAVLAAAVCIACFCKKHHRRKEKPVVEETPATSQAEKAEMFSIPLGTQTKVDCKGDDIGPAVEVVAHYNHDISEKLPLQCYGSVL